MSAKGGRPVGSSGGASVCGGGTVQAKECDTVPAQPCQGQENPKPTCGAIVDPCQNTGGVSIGTGSVTIGTGGHQVPVPCQGAGRNTGGASVGLGGGAQGIVDPCQNTSGISVGTGSVTIGTGGNQVADLCQSAGGHIGGLGGGAQGTVNPCQSAVGGSIGIGGQQGSVDSSQQSLGQGARVQVTGANSGVKGARK